LKITNGNGRDKNKANKQKDDAADSMERNYVTMHTAHLTKEEQLCKFDPTKKKETVIV